MSRRLLLTTLFAFSCLPTFAADSDIFIASDRKTLRMVAPATKADAFSRARVESTIKSAFFKDSGQDELTWLATADDKGFSQSSLDDFARAASGREIVLFVHGCCVSFKEMEHQARDLDNGLKGSLKDRVILVAYDWATPALMYNGSLKTMETTQMRFNRFMDELRRKLPEHRISIVMHSLGGNLFIKYLTQSQIKLSATELEKPFRVLIFSRPDMSFDHFRPHLAEVASTASESFILAAENDININLSGFIRSLPKKTFGSFRLGQFHNARELTPQLKVMDIGALKQGHLIPYTLIGNILANF